jgi:hypothetical protein
MKRSVCVRVLALSFAAGLFACTGQLSQGNEVDSKSQHAENGVDYSITRPGNRYAGPVGDEYVDEIQPLIAERCAVCHSCTNGPCQLNMTSYAALVRGLSSTNPYDFGLFEKKPTRVGDNRSTADWRAQGFKSVLPGDGVAPEKSVFYLALERGEANLANTDPTQGPLNDTTTRALAQAHDQGKYVCPATQSDYAKLVKQYPQGGMPWALPNDAPVHDALENWVLAGAKGPSAAAQKALSSPQQTAHSTMDANEVVARWEAFLDGNDLRSQLVGRYLFEHAYSVNIHLTENPGEFYRIVRSRTGAPAAIDRIQTDMPQNDPGVSRVHYRMEKIDRVIEGKTHVPWERSLADLDHLRDQFLGGNWNVSKLPDYKTTNPFVAFDPIPATARAHFMLENSQMLYAAFARGPICLIPAASYAVDEYFWIIFMDPASDPSVQKPKLGLNNYDTFFAKDSGFLSGIPVLGDKFGEPTYRAAFEKTLRELKPQGLGIQDIWKGDGTNENAWLTVHRHQYSVDVHSTKFRPITGLPKSVWFISYANFERMYYNAVADYKYWGNVLHQSDSFSWQIYTRTEAEDMYASLFPSEDYRSELRSHYSSTKGNLYYKFFTNYIQGRPSASPEYTTEDALARALMVQMGDGVMGAEDRLNNWPNNALPTGIPASVTSAEDFEAGLRTLTNRILPYSRYFPNAVHVRLNGDQLYTLIAVREHNDDRIPSAEKSARIPERDYVVAIPGFAAFEAHMFVDLSYDEAAGFLQGLSDVHDQASWNAFNRKYKVGRNSPEFWPFVDFMHAWQGEHMPLRAGLMELRMYDMDETPF